MSTLKDVYEVMNRIIWASRFFGVTGEFSKHCLEKIKLISATLREESGVSLALGQQLDQETVLPEKTEKLFQEFKTWLSEQHPALKQ